MKVSAQWRSLSRALHASAAGTSLVLLLLVAAPLHAENIVYVSVPSDSHQSNNVPHYPISYTMSGGGTGYGGGFDLLVGNWSTIGWCVDLLDDVNIPQAAYLTDEVRLGGSDWTNGTSPYVVRGQNTTWYDTTYTLTPLQRYQVAAYLISEMSGFPNGPNANNSTNRNLNTAIWAATASADAYGILSTYFTGASVTDFNNAAQYIQAHPTWGYGQFEVISGPVTANGTLAPGTATGVTTPYYQTFIVAVPESGTLTLLGIGLVCLALALGRGRRQAALARSTVRRVR